MKRPPLTPREKEVYDYLKQHYKEHKYCPPSKVSAAHFGLSRLGIEWHIRKLVKKGYIKKPSQTIVIPL